MEEERHFDQKEQNLPLKSREDPDSVPSKDFITREKQIRFKDRIAGNLAVLLVAILFVLILIHYTVTVFFAVYRIDNTHVNEVFNSWLPVISGFVGSAVTYYFTREEKR